MDADDLPVAADFLDGNVEGDSRLGIFGGDTLTSTCSLASEGASL